MSSQAEALDRSTISLLTVRELREIFGVSRSTIYRWVDKGQLKRAGRIQAPDDYHSQRVVLLEVVDPRLADKVRDYVSERIRTGSPPTFLTQRLALASLTSDPSIMRGRGDGQESKTLHFMEDFEDLLSRLSAETHARHQFLNELETAAQALRADPKLEQQTRQLEEVLLALKEIRMKEATLLDLARSEKLAGNNAVCVEIEDEEAEPYDMTPEEDELDEQFLEAIPIEAPNQQIEIDVDLEEEEEELVPPKVTMPDWLGGDSDDES